VTRKRFGGTATSFVAVLLAIGACGSEPSEVKPTAVALGPGSLSASRCTPPAQPPARMAHALDAFEQSGQTVVADKLPSVPVDPQGTPYVRARIMTIIGPLPHSGGIVVARFSSLRECYVEARQRQPGLTGLMSLGFVVKPSGEIDPGSIEIAEKMGYAPLAECVRARLLCARFSRQDEETSFRLELALNVEHHKGVGQ
jgi:hypothetical protein